MIRVTATSGGLMHIYEVYILSGAGLAATKLVPGPRRDPPILTLKKNFCQFLDF